MRYLLIFLTFHFFTSVEEPLQDSPSLELKTGEQAAIGNVTIKFKKVLSDSRCPRGVTCIWAGEAKVLVAIYKDNRLVGDEILILENVGSQISRFNKYFPAMDFELVAGRLQPYPEAGHKIAMKDYCLSLQFDKKETDKGD